MDGERGGVGAEVTRRSFLRAAGAGAAWVALAGTLGCDPAEQEDRAGASPLKPGESSVRGLPPARSGPARIFRSRPDLTPPTVAVGKPAGGTAPGYVFVAPKKGPGQDGPMILDNDGQPVWFRPLQGEEQDTMDFKTQTYRGKPVLTWWEGVHLAYGQGEYVIFDPAYREVARVRAGNGLDGDHHEFLITERDTALITIYAEVPYDLSPLGGPEEGRVAESIVQEIDIETGEVLFQWRSLEHVPVEETHGDLPDDPTNAYDYFHINSIDVDDDDNLLVSARRTFTVYKIDRESGEVLWRLGGKKSDFEMGEGTRTLYQHDARRQPDGTVTLFDNGGMYVSEESRVVGIQPNEDEMTATLAREYTHPEGVLALTQGNAQRLPNGNLFVGWGSEPVFSEFSGDGELLFSARFPAEVESYRAFRHPWTGRPDTLPTLAAAPAPDDGITLYASWNGATEVEQWEVLAGPTLDRLEPVGSVPRTGFETAIAVRTGDALVGVRALDGAGGALGTSRTVNIRA
ncbi:MAG: arylsulfotransferase family protein [Actinomycetota bacterium]|nr:arylsulfotransferase family protein [Actinomycetota bacterium]